MGKPDLEISENSRIFGNIYASRPFRNLLPKAKQKAAEISANRSKFRSDGENIAPIDPNIQINGSQLSGSFPISKKSLSKVKFDTRKEELRASAVQKEVDGDLDLPVKVVVRIKPVNGPAVGSTSIGNLTKDSLSIAERSYTFDSVFDINSTQEDIYRRIGAPLVKDAISGYNASIVAYGQTGSGKTHTMWGPPSAMVEGQTTTGLQGIVPRIFQDLFSEIQKDQESSTGKQINYHCRCSFLEIYDERIGDLLDPSQRDLEIKDDPRNGFYVENLTEEYVNCYEDVAHILIMGLSNRKVGATSVNSKSSRSHIMFTCVIESWCKEASSMCLGTSKTSRINLVDLAGFERNILGDSNRQHLKETKYIKKSLSKLGRIVNVLAQGDKSSMLKEVPYRNSCMTHLLRDSFGGNAKLSIICTIFPDNINCSETTSTLRFGSRAKLMKNEPIVNEFKEDEVNDLSDQIRQLKEELMRAKSSNSLRGGNERHILNKLRLSLNRSLISSCIEMESEEKLCITVDDVKELKLQIDNVRNSAEEDSFKDVSENEESSLLYSADGCQIESHCEDYLSCSEASEEEEDEEMNSSGTQPVDQPDDDVTQHPLSVSESNQSTVLQDPELSESPKIKECLKKSSDIMQINEIPSLENEEETSTKSVVMYLDKSKPSLRSSRIFGGPTDTLAASLQKGLQMIDNHQKNSGPVRSSTSFSFEHLALMASPSADKANVYLQTSSPIGRRSSDQTLASFLCIRCKSSSGLTDEERKDTEKEVQREKELGLICKEQAAEIENLKKMIEEFKNLGAQTDSTCRGSSNFLDIKNQQLEPIIENEPDECHQENDENQPLEKDEDLKNGFSFEEKEAFLREIEHLRNKLQFYINASTRRSSDKLRSSLLSQSMQLRKSIAVAQVNTPEEFEKERQKWMEMESEWISLTDELRIDIESNRERAEQKEIELTLEKKCTEELDDALKRSVVGHARLIEHYTELQEEHNDILIKYRSMMEWLAEVKKSVCKAGGKGRQGARLAKALASELSSARAQRERERIMLRKENHSLKIQLKNTAEAVHAAGELLVRLREAEETASQAEEGRGAIEEENKKLRKQMEKVKQKHKMEMSTMKQFLAESRLPEAALRGVSREDSEECSGGVLRDDDQAWRAEFGAIYQDHY